MMHVFKHYLDCLTDKHTATADLNKARIAFKNAFRTDRRECTNRLWTEDKGGRIGTIMYEPFDQLPLQDVLICLTNIVARDRIYGSIKGAEESGAMRDLLLRLQVLTKDEPMDELDGAMAAYRACLGCEYPAYALPSMTVPSMLNEIRSALEVGVPLVKIEYVDPD